LAQPIIGLTNGVGLISNCEYYSVSTASTNCISCKKGYRGKIKNDANNVGYIEQCIAFTDCDTSKTVEHSIHSNVTIANYPFVTTYNQNTYDLNVFFNGCGGCTTATNVLVAFVGPLLIPV
jgi:hypothetical protein